MSILLTSKKTLPVRRDGQIQASTLGGRGGASLGGGASVPAGSFQPMLNSGGTTAFVKATGTLISYDTNTYLPASSFSSLFELAGTVPNQYIRAKYPFACDYNISAHASTGWLPPTIWESLPKASALAYGVVKAGANITVVNGVISSSASSGVSSWNDLTDKPTALSYFTNNLGNYGDFVVGTPWTAMGYLTGTPALSTRAYKCDQLEAYTSSGFTGGDYYLRAIRNSGWETRLYMGGYRDATLQNSVQVNYADRAGTVAHFASRTDPTQYNIVWANGVESPLYSCNDVRIRSSDGTIFSTHYCGSGNWGGTGEASHHPSGIYSSGPSWLYGNIIQNEKNITGNSTISSSGTHTATNFILSSDRRLKTNIAPIPSSPIDIEYKQFEMLSEPGQLRYGVIAQELQKTNPELVRTNEKGMLSVAYIDLLIKEVAALKSEVAELKGRVW